MAGGFMSILQSFFDKLFGRRKPETPVVSPPITSPDSTDEPAQIVTLKILALIYDPILDPASGEKLSQRMRWNRPEDLETAFAAELLEVSGGMARVQIAQRIEINEFPDLADGFRYTPAAYLDVLRGVSQPHKPSDIDYQKILAKYNILQRVGRGEIDEVWIFGFPYAGLYESTMGGKGAFWCNAPILKNTQTCPRRFVVMGFNYERGVGEMMESFGHRAESILAKTFEPLSGEANLWLRFIRYDKVSPGKAEVGTIHFAPNSERDYDWNNPRLVNSFCDNWYRFPDLSGPARMVNADEWGNGNIRLHHRWWFKHIPHAAGRQNGIHNNWWQYIMDANNVGK